MKKALILLALPLFLLISIIVVYSNDVLAYSWPGRKWSNVPMSIKLEYNSAHKYTATTFGVYFEGNTTIKPDGTAADGSFTVRIVHSECRLAGGKYVFYRVLNNNPTNETCGGSGDFNVGFGTGTGEYNANIDMTVYKIRVSIPGDDGNSLQFNVQADAAYAIGFLAWDGLEGYFSQTPIVIDDPGKLNWSDVNIQIHEDCNKVPDGRKLFTFYDLDNKNSLPYAQDNGGQIGNPDRWTSGGDGPYPYDFRNLKIGLQRHDTKVLKKANGETAYYYATPPWSWEKNSNNFYIPNNTGSGQYGGLIHGFANNNEVFNLLFNDLNHDNYMAFSSPYDEYVKKCRNPPNNWELTSKSKVDGVDKKTIFTGTTVEFKHWVWDTGKDPVVDTTISVGLSGVGGALNDSYENQAVGEAAAWYKPRSVTIPNVGDEQCDTVKYSPQKMVNDVVSGEGSSKACVHAIDPTSVVSKKAQYEKGGNSIDGITSRIDVNDGRVCPAQAINIQYKWKIVDTTTNQTYGAGSPSFNYGAGVCDPPKDIIKLNNTLKTILNNKSPGPSGIQYCLSVNSEPEVCGDIEVYEVPFARFYGNDIYATREDATGEIRFNDATSDPDYNGKGSASQYAALAFGAVKIDTAAYRHPDYYASFNANAAITSTLPPNGLDAANSKFGARSATDEYNKVVANIPNNCTAFPGNLNVATGCYTATGETTINATNYSNKVTLKAETVVIKGNNVVVPPPPPPAPDPPAPQPDPKPRDDGLNVVTISTIDSNRRSYERTFDVGSYYSVDKLFGSTGVRCGEYIFSPCIRDITFRKPGYKVTFVGSRFLGGEVTVTNNFNYRSITGDRTFLSWQAANQRYIQYFKVESTAPAAVTNRVSPMAPTPAAEAAFVGDPPEAGPLDGADPNLPTGIALIVADNIYIDKSVERIDAILVAKNAIYTCTEGAAQIPNADLENTNKCRKTLTVNGAISAPTIKFQRVGGSRYLNNPRSADDKETCHISHGIQNCDARGDIANDSGKTAEVINFPAYLYFTSPYLKNNTDPGTPRLDNMFTAPPRQ